MARSADFKTQLENILTSLPLEKQTAQDRKAFLELSQQDGVLLKELAPGLKGVHQQLMDEFYRHLQAFPETNRLLTNEQTVARLKQQQSDYFSRLLGGQYDEDYIQNRLRIGAVHQMVGLEIEWYIGDGLDGLVAVELCSVV